MHNVKKYGGKKLHTDNQIYKKASTRRTSKDREKYKSLLMIYIDHILTCDMVTCTS